MTIPARARYSGYRFPAEIISHAVWLYFRFPLGLRMVEELLAARGIIVSHETVQTLKPLTAVSSRRASNNHGDRGGSLAECRFGSTDLCRTFRSTRLIVGAR
jgi:hypothetical protein